ncbi:MAG TPA: hypothetical protein PLW09_01570 [Candidatus Kapabacteria bacterium]|jgi:hypothetical protein|nr:hypothetical protein [Candidatus Kapabacteria bacterium]
MTYRLRFIILTSLIYFVGIISVYAQQDSLTIQKTNGGTVSNSQSDGPPREVIDITDVFFKSVIKGDAKRALERLLKETRMAEKEETMKGLLETVKRANEIYGDIRNYEVVSYENLSASFTRLRCIALHPDFPMRWVFTFYRSPVKGWVTINVKLDDDSQYLFSED